MKRRNLLFGTSLAVLAGAAVWAQGSGKKPAYVEAISAEVKPAPVAPGAKATLAITLKVAEGYHVNANKPDDPNMIPTEVSVTPAKGAPVTVGAPQFPAAQTISVGYSDKPAKVYEGTVTISVPVTVKKGATGKHTLEGTVSLQGCNATSCFPPATLPFSAPLVVRGAK